MAYTVKNYKTKKQVKEDLKAGVKIEVYQPNADLTGAYVKPGKVYLEGPHYPQAHTWYAEAQVIEDPESGRMILTKIK